MRATRGHVSPNKGLAAGYAEDDAARALGKTGTLLALCQQVHSGFKEELSMTKASVSYHRAERAADQLSAWDANTRRFALQSLGLLGPKASDHLPEMAKLLEDEEPEVRKAAAQACGRVGGGARDLAMALKDAEAAVRSEAATALGGMDSFGLFLKDHVGLEVTAAWYSCSIPLYSGLNEIELLEVADVDCLGPVQDDIQELVLEKPSEERPFVFLWDEKTGGTTFNDWLLASAANLGLLNSTHISDFGWPNVIGTPFFLKTYETKKLKSLQILSATVDWNIFAVLGCAAQRRPSCFVLLRNPIDRFLSYYLERSDRSLEGLHP
ncbi:Uncharacterized protein SCF082_LOCUS19230 [Durusdinium trenchii]|uniref:Uncharacterized protein n=1 Tax=Durusdinium trenchii TaxID=1381693 RepID=A0ABP0KUV2_9DINO